MIDCDEAAGVFSLRLVGAKISLDFRSRKQAKKMFLLRPHLRVFLSVSFFCLYHKDVHFSGTAHCRKIFFCSIFSLTIRNGL